MFADDIVRHITYIEMIVGMGLITGPAVASMVYGTLHYSGTMYFFGVLNMISMTLCYIFIPNELNNSAA